MQNSKMQDILDLPTPEKSIKQVEKEQLKRLKNRKTKLMLDE